MHGTPLSSEDDDDRVLLAPRSIPLHARTGSSSSSVIDFLDYPPGVIGLAGSPGKKLSSTKARLTPSRVQAKNAFKSSVSGLTAKERLQQMGVGAANDFLGDDDFSDSSEQQQYLRTQPQPRFLGSGSRSGSNQLGRNDWPGPGTSPNQYGLSMNGRRMESGIY
jgi:hypothetical protein